MGCRVVIVYTPAEKRGGGYLIGGFGPIASAIRRAIAARRKNVKRMSLRPERMSRRRDGGAVSPAWAVPCPPRADID